MTSPTAGPPDGPAATAGIISRAAAFVVDSLLTVLGILICSVGWGLVHAVFTGTFDTGTRLGPAAVLAFSPLVFGLYCVIGWSWAGLTVGKALMGLRVVDRAGARPSIARSIVRVLGYIVSSILWVGFIWIAIDRDREGFHDKIARTRVIYNKP